MIKISIKSKKKKINKKKHIFRTIIINDNINQTHLIGYGTYSQVYSPPIPCIKTDECQEKMSSEYISKVINKEFAEKEIIGAKLIDTIDPYQEWHVGFPVKCVPLNNAIKNIPYDKDDCIIIYKYGGLTLKEILRNYIKEYINYDTFGIFMSSMVKYIFKGLQIINSKNITHLDVSLANILVDHNFISRLIDFGFTMNIDDYDNDRETYKDNWITYTQPYMYYTPYMTVLAYLLNNDEFKSVDLDEYFEGYYNKLTIDHYGKNTNFQSDNIEERRAMCKYITIPSKDEYVKKCYELVENNKCHAIIEQSDMFGFGVSISRMLCAFENIIPINIKDNIVNIIKKMTDFNDKTSYQELYNMLLEI